MPTINPASTQRRTALTLLNTVLGEIGMPSISSVSATDDTAVQLLYLANGFGSRLARLPFWTELIEEFSITTDGSSSYDLPIDWGVPLADTQWDRSASWPLRGPTTPRTWQIFQSGIGAVGPQYRYRYKGSTIEFTPTPDSSLTLVQEYLSTGWALGLAGDTATERKPRITDNSDYVLFDEEMFICGVKLAWLEAKGLDSSKALIDFTEMLEAGWSSTRGANTLSLVPQVTLPFLSESNIPDHGYGSD